MTLTGIPIELMTPGSPEWLRKMSASKVAAVLGLSPYDSRFSLYFRMRDGIDINDPDDPQLSRGHYLEPAIVSWFADQHPEWSVESGGCWAHPDHDWYTASPDALIYLPRPGETSGGVAMAGLEVKTEADGDGWGEAGTDQVPVEVRAQVISQMDIVGTRRTYVAVLLPYLEFRSYVVDYDQGEADLIREECAQFMDDLANDVRPDIDAHTATLQTLRVTHPLIEQVDVEIDPPLAESYQSACADEKTAKASKRLVTSLLLDAMGNARRALCLGEPVAVRVAVGDATPFLRPARSKT